jgi:hypothetical protein
MALKNLPTASLRKLPPTTEMLANLLPFFRGKLAEASKVLPNRGSLFRRQRLPEPVVLKHAPLLLGRESGPLFTVALDQPLFFLCEVGLAGLWSHRR